MCVFYFAEVSLAGFPAHLRNASSRFPYDFAHWRDVRSLEAVTDGAEFTIRPGRVRSSPAHGARATFISAGARRRENRRRGVPPLGPDRCCGNRFHASGAASLPASRPIVFITARSRAQIINKARVVPRRAMAIHQTAPRASPETEKRTGCSVPGASDADPKAFSERREGDLPLTSGLTRLA